LENLTKMKQICGWAICITLAAMPAAIQAAGKGDPAKGKVVFEPCVVCHSADSDVKKIGPGLKGLFKKDKLANGKKPTEANIRTKIDEGGNGMPAYKDMLGDREKDDLIAYLKTL
jgi:cytochrome c